MIEKMRAEYELNIDDVLSFLLYNSEHNLKLGRFRKLARRALLAVAGVFLLVAVMLWAVYGREFLIFIILLVVYALLVLLVYIIAPPLMRKSMKKLIARDYGHGNDKLTGKHMLTISPDNVADVTDMGETSTRWNAIEWIAATDQYLFMTTRGPGPYIVPRKAFADKEAFNRFIDKVRAYHQAATLSA